MQWKYLFVNTIVALVRRALFSTARVIFMCTIVEETPYYLMLYEIVLNCHRRSLSLVSIHKKVAHKIKLNIEQVVYNKVSDRFHKTQSKLIFKMWFFSNYLSTFQYSLYTAEQILIKQIKPFFMYKSNLQLQCDIPLRITLRTLQSRYTFQMLERTVNWMVYTRSYFCASFLWLDTNWIEKLLERGAGCI